MPKSVYNPTSNDIFPGTGPRPNRDTVGEFGVRSMFPPDPSGIWLDRGLSGPHSPLLPPVVGTAANSPTVSTDVQAWADGLDGVVDRIAPRFGRPEPRRRARAY